MSRKSLLSVCIAASMLATAGIAHANFEGTISSYPPTAKSVTLSAIKAGYYQAYCANGMGSKMIIGKPTADGYPVETATDSALYNFYPNGADTYVLTVHQKGGARYGYFLAAFSRGGMVTYDTTPFAAKLLKRSTKALSLPYGTSEQNKAFLALLGKNVSGMPVLCRASPSS